MKTFKGLFVAALLMLTAACGGGGGSTPSNTVTGVASAGIIKGGTVKVYAADTRKLLGSTKTDTVTGRYTLNVGSYTGPVVVEVFGGNYTDEATGITVTDAIKETAPLRAMTVVTAGEVNVAVTPLTELAARQAEVLVAAGTNVADAIPKANAQISDLFQVEDIITTQPLDASAPLTGSADEKNYTLVLAALSQMALDPAKLTVTLDTVSTAIDAAGTMTPEVTNTVKDALAAFLAPTNTEINKTGINTVPETLNSIGVTNVTLTLVLSGTGVKGIDTSITFPTFVKVATADNGALAAGVLTNLSGGTDYSLEGGSLVAGSLHMIFNLGDLNATIPAGDIVNIKFTVDAGQAAPASAFALKDTLIYGSDKLPVAGAAITFAIR